MVEQVLKIGLLGLGTVGCGAANILEKNADAIAKKAGCRIKVAKAFVRNTSRPRPVNLEGIELTTDPEAILGDPEIPVVVEVMGGIEQARQYITRALERGKYVVTANKDLMAQHGSELLELAEKNNVNIYYEASVGGGIPLIKPLKHSLAANRIYRIMGIINGTTNYILTRMSEDGCEFAEALAEAQAKGFAEQDPSSDLEGRDAAFKLAILSSLAFGTGIKPQDIYTESVTRITGRDIQYARELGFVIKLLAMGERTDQGLSLRVHPMLIPVSHPLAAIKDEFNALYVEGDAVGEVMFYGRGAGSLPTGSAITADIIDVARNISNQARHAIIETGFSPQNILPMDEQISRFYLRVQVTDQPGVFAGLATAFAQEEISLDMIIQKQSESQVAEIVLVTHDVSEQSFHQALNRIMALDAVKEVNNVIRVFEGS